ncbi:hypothetical protein B0H16DRAFT_1525396 [Mycena metata]|uniref:SSCRP protein n=1 Tax=Mycena metata TaxID=1033252 RepID=A0AAD7JH14_9AGAR|nr:hypothetical protein B0H16DRAFT_1525396 [Mycena metata]
MKFTTAIFAAVAFAALVAGAAVDKVDTVNATVQAAGVIPLAAPFAINIGENTAQDNVLAWVSGQDQCKKAVIIGPIGASFCGRNFVLNGITFVAGGCGGPQTWITQVSKGGVFALCTSFSEADRCGVHTLYHCV